MRGNLQSGRGNKLKSNKGEEGWMYWYPTLSPCLLHYARPWFPSLDPWGFQCCYQYLLIGNFESDRVWGGRRIIYHLNMTIFLQIYEEGTIRIRNPSCFFQPFLPHLSNFAIFIQVSIWVAPHTRKWDPFII